MKELLKRKIDGLNEEMSVFSRALSSADGAANVSGVSSLIQEQMRRIGFDKVSLDKAGNMIGYIKGYRQGGSIVMVSHMDVSKKDDKSSQSASDDMVRFKSGIITALFSAALVKKSLIPLNGDLIICCVPRHESSSSGIRYLFDNSLKTPSIKGVLLCEPTDLNVFLGHKGRMEYEIIVKGRLNRDFLENRGMNMLGTMFPLINELEKVSRQLPSDQSLGRSDLRIKDVRYSGYEPKKELSEFRVVVDRVFIPEEDLGGILAKAKSIAKSIYKDEPDVTVNTVLSKERIRTYSGMELVAEKESRPWTMESHHPFALESLRCLNEAGFKSGFGYWKKTFTEGSFTFAQRNIPTIGFGAGSEGQLVSAAVSLSLDRIKKAVYGQALIVQRNIGLPAFGWSCDEI